MPSLNEFVGFYSNQKTASGYKTALIHFFALTYDQPKQGREVTPEEAEEYDRLSKQYLAEGRDHAADLMRFAVSLSPSPPKTAQLYMAATKQYLLENDIEISQRAWKRIRGKLPKGGARTMEKELTRTTLREILLHMDTNARAYNLLLASTGMRPGEALKLELDDIDLSQDPPQINVRGEIAKNGNPRIAFLSHEAAEAIRAWLQVRDQYIRSSMYRNAGLQRRGHTVKTLDDTRLYPYTYTVVITSWTNALKKSGHHSVDKSTRRLQLHPHMLRKYFLSQFISSSNIKIGEELAGHDGYLTAEYRRIPRAELAAEYKKVEPRLTILAPEDYGELTERDRTALQRQAEMISRLSAEKEALETRLLSLEGDVQAMREFEAEIRRELQAEP
jgi:integrase